MAKCKQKDVNPKKVKSGIAINNTVTENEECL